MPCAEARDALLEAVTGRVPPDRRQAVVTHLAFCPACRQLAAELEETVGLLRADPDPEPPEGFWPAFMVRLEDRIGARPVTVRARLRRALRAPGRLLPAAATAAAALALTLSAVLLRPPLEPAHLSPAAQVAPYVTDSVRALLPHLDETLQIWESALGGAEVESLLEAPRAP